MSGLETPGLQIIEIKYIAIASNQCCVALKFSIFNCIIIKYNTRHEKRKKEKLY